MSIDAMIGQLAVALADYLPNATPDDIRQIHRFTDAAAPGWLDQIDAARTQTTAIAPETCEWDGDPQGIAASVAAIPAWLRIGAMEALARHIVARSATCIHAPHPSRPQPVAAAAWRPGFVACMACVGRHFHLRGERAYTCDGCGRLGENIHAGRIVVGPILFMFGVCPECRTELPEEGKAL